MYGALLQELSLLRSVHASADYPTRVQFVRHSVPRSARPFPASTATTATEDPGVAKLPRNSQDLPHGTLPGGRLHHVRSGRK